MDTTLTDQAFWKDYWDHRDVRVTVGPKYLFHKLLRQYCGSQPIRNSIEIGGFPGYFSVFLAKYCNVEPTLLDFYIDPAKVRQLCAANDVAFDRLEMIEHDFLSFQSERKYDLVFSCGLIEHFENYDELIARHVDLLAPGGRLFIEIPNLRGLNGWMQSRWDPQNLAIHNLDCMDPTRLRHVVQRHQLGNVQVGYYGRYGSWLEQCDQKPWRVRAAYRTIHYVCRKLTRLVPVETRLFSPYIVITGVNGGGVSQTPASQSATTSMPPIRAA